MLWGAASKSPYHQHQAYSGLVIGGIHGTDCDPSMNCDTRINWAGAVEMISPSHHTTEGITLRGMNSHAGQCRSFGRPAPGAR
jgi:hypothetical protein